MEITAPAAASWSPPQHRTQVFVGRTALLRETHAALTTAGAAGAVLIGEPGIGKTALMGEALNRVEGDFHTVYVRPSALAAKLPYGALSFLLAELDPELVPHPVLIIQNLTTLLTQQANGLPILFAIDDVELLDEFSATVVHQLVRDGAARVVLATRDFTTAPSQFTALWREGLLRRLDVGPLDTDECREYLVAQLGHRISYSAIGALEVSSGGNPLLLRMACSDFQEARRLVLHHGVWVLRPGDAAQGRLTSDAISGQLPDYSAGQREVMELLSLAGSLPLPLLLAVSPESDIDLLQEKNVISIEPSAGRAVRLSSALMGQTVASRVGVGRRRALYEKLAAAAGGWGELPLEPSAHAAWVTSYGAPLPEALALPAAKAANICSDHRLAIQFIDAAEQRTPALAYESAAACIALADYQAAEAVIGSCRSTTPSMSIAEWGFLKIAESRLRQRMGLDGPGELLGEVKGRLEREAVPGGFGADPDPLSLELTLAEAELASHEGRFGENAGTLREIYRAATYADPNFKVQIGSWLCEAWAVGDRQDEAVNLAEELLQHLSDPWLSAQSSTLARRQIAAAHRLAGAWRKYQRIIEAHAIPKAAEGGPAAAPRDLLEGLALAYRAETRAAVKLLLPALSQLEISDPWRALPLLRTAAAYCLAAEGDEHQAREQLGQYHQTGAVSWRICREADHFAALATAELGSRHEAIAQLTALANDDQRRGTHAYELAALYQAVRLGDRSCLERLLAVAAVARGPFARLCETYAKGLNSQDAQLLLQVVEQAQRDGDRAFGRDASEAALRLVMASGDRSRIRSMQRSVRAALDGAPDRPLSDDRLKVLTARELEIAGRAAAGASNKDMAREMCVSVRTIEGHLYRVYAKLYVSSRAELARVLSHERTAS